MSAIITNIVTTSNVNKMKCHIFSMVEPFTGVAQMYANIQTAMSHFNYENENVETIVFVHLNEMCNNINN